MVHPSWNLINKACLVLVLEKEARRYYVQDEIWKNYRIINWNGCLILPAAACICFGTVFNLDMVTIRYISLLKLWKWVPCILFIVITNGLYIYANIQSFGPVSTNDSNMLENHSKLKKKRRSFQIVTDRRFSNPQNVFGKTSNWQTFKRFTGLLCGEFKRWANPMLSSHCVLCVLVHSVSEDSCSSVSTRSSIFTEIHSGAEAQWSRLLYCKLMVAKNFPVYG